MNMLVAQCLCEGGRAEVSVRPFLGSSRSVVLEHYMWTATDSS